jgi:hypothetical integral membrane protein (TIGR02206 family)
MPPLLAQVRGAAPVPAGDFWTVFASFTAFHLVTVTACVALMIGACRMGLWWRGGERERRFRLTWGWTIVVVKSVETVYWFWPSNFTLEDSFPLQLCDLAAVTAAVAMLTRWRLSRTMLYFWGIGLSTQAFVTPTVSSGLASAHFWFFWITHLMVVGSAIYDLVVHGYRPHWRDFVSAWFVTAAWVALVTVLNTSLGLNYGFIGNKVPERPTIINTLGEWPLRLFIVVGIVTAMYVLLWAAWPLVYRAIGRAYPPLSRDEPAPHAA